MARVTLTARVTESQAAVLRGYAEEAGLPLYQATVRALELGIAALVGRHNIEPPQHASSIAGSEIDALREAVERLTTRAELTDRLVQRTLYAAGAAYATGLAVAAESITAERLEGLKAEVARDSDTIFDRQLAKAQEA